MPSLQDGHQHKPQPAISPERGGFERYNKTLGASWRHWTGDGSKPWYLVNPKIAGKWMFIPLKMVSIGIDPYPTQSVHRCSDNRCNLRVCSESGPFHDPSGLPKFHRPTWESWPKTKMAMGSLLLQRLVLVVRLRGNSFAIFFGMSFWHFLTLTQADTAELWIRCQGIWHRISCTNGKHQLPTLLQSQHWLKSMLGKIYSKKHVKNKRAIHNFFRVS